MFASTVLDASLVRLHRRSPLHVTDDYRVAWAQTVGRYCTGLTSPNCSVDMRMRKNPARVKVSAHLEESRL